MRLRSELVLSLFMKETILYSPPTCISCCSIGSGLDDNSTTSNGSSARGGIEFVFPPVAPDWYTNYALYIGGGFHVILSIWMVLEYFLRTGPDIKFHLFSTFM